MVRWGRAFLGGPGLFAALRLDGLKGGAGDAWLAGGSYWVHAMVVEVVGGRRRTTWLPCVAFHRTFAVPGFEPFTASGGSRAWHDAVAFGSLNRIGESVRACTKTSSQLSGT